VIRPEQSQSPEFLACHKDDPTFLESREHLFERVDVAVLETFRNVFPRFERLAGPFDALKMVEKTSNHLGPYSQNFSFFLTNELAQ